jgi:NAD(P)-dependent dehydrogenase (short-subunit alcohol dehydrogenase family)
LFRVDAVCPTIIDTAMTDRFTGGTGRRPPRGNQSRANRTWVKPEKIANAVLWPYSDASLFVLGHAMVVDGGQTVVRVALVVTPSGYH